MTRIYLVRHAQAEGNFYRRAHGSYDSLVTEQGYRQIEALHKRFHDTPVDVIYSSPRYRTRTTALGLRQEKQVPMYVLNDLQEISCGPWEDRTWGDIRYQDSEQLDNFNYHFEKWYVPGAETMEHVRERMLRAMETIVRECPDMTVAAVSHGMASRILLGTLRGMSLAEISENFPHGDNTAVSLIEYNDGEYQVVYANDASHLTPEISTLAHQSWWKGKVQPEIGLRFLSLNPQTADGAALYCRCRAEGWMSSHGTMDCYNEKSFLQEAQNNSRVYGEALLGAYAGDTFAGLLQLDTERDRAQGVGRIPFVYMTPEYRKKGVGVQLIGEAISRYRAMGRQTLRLRCAQENEIAQGFYARCGFHKSGIDPTAPVRLDMLEKYIGY